MTLPIQDFIDRFQRAHHTRIAVLLGKGPSLDQYNEKKAPVGAYVMAVNEVPLVRLCDGVLYIHRRFDRLDYSPVRDIIRSLPGIDAHDGRGWYFHEIVSAPISDYLARPEMLFPTPGGSSGLALEILSLCGVRRVYMWGYDSLAEPPNHSLAYARCLDGRTTCIPSERERMLPIVRVGMFETIERFALDVRLMPWGITLPPHN